MMRRAFWFILLGLFLVPSVTLATSDGQTTRLFMPDGQLKSHTVRVYVTHDISANQQPRLMLLRSHSVTKKAVDETTQIEPGIVAPGQEWVERVSGQEVRRSGTLLLFDLSTLKFRCKAMMRVMPVVNWTEGGLKHIVVSSREVNLGNIVAAAGFINYVAWLLRLPRSKSLLARSWLTIGEVIELEDAEAGFDVVIFKRGGGNQPGPHVVDAPGHVGFFAGIEGRNILLLGGNQGDSVSIGSYPKSRLLGVRRLG